MGRALVNCIGLVTRRRLFSCSFLQSCSTEHCALERCVVICTCGQAWCAYAHLTRNDFVVIRSDGVFDLCLSTARALSACLVQQFLVTCCELVASGLFHASYHCQTHLTPFLHNI